MIKKYTTKNGETRYMLKAYLGVDPLTGKQKRTTRRGFKSKKEAKQAEAQENIATLSADSVEYMRLSREATITGQVYTSLVQNYDQTRIQEAKDSKNIRRLCL